MLAAFVAGALMLHAQLTEQQFKLTCKRCHGDDGKGHTLVGRMVNAADLTSDTVSKRSDAELATVIRKGKGKMSGFGEQLGGDAGVAKMLNYVRSLGK